VQANAVRVDALTVFGSLEVVVPPDVRVEQQATQLFGSQRCDACNRPAPASGKALVVHSLTLFGDLDIR
jgi:hypothetical protein